MAERHLAMQITHTIGFLRGIAARLDALSARSLQAAAPEFRRAAADCREQAEHLARLLQGEGYDRVY